MLQIILDNPDNESEDFENLSIHINDDQNSSVVEVQQTNNEITPIVEHNTSSEIKTEDSVNLPDTGETANKGVIGVGILSLLIGIYLTDRKK